MELVKRYAGRRAKPPLSQWCAAKSFPYLAFTSDGVRRERMAGHVVCQGQRWHSRDHLDCCGSDDERESYACRCPCHPVRPPGWGGRG